MTELWFSLNRIDQADALEMAAEKLARPTHLLEKDIWVVWALSVVYQSPLGSKLTFKGGTSLSKAYKIIDRFSEDVDLTYDIRELVPDVLRNRSPIPVSASQQSKITDAVRKRLPQWINAEIKPLLETALIAQGMQAVLNLVDHDKLILRYSPIKTGTGYCAPTIQLEFGARATGEPHHLHSVSCDMEEVFNDIAFPQATPLVMNVERTFWEKATAAHVYCLQGRLRGERFSRHWYDLAAIASSQYFESTACDHAVAQQVAQHKTMFFAEKDGQGNKIDYFKAVNGSLELVPRGESLLALQHDYNAMIEDGLLMQQQPSFAEIIEICQRMQNQLNKMKDTDSL